MAEFNHHNRRRRLSAAEYVEGVLAGNRAILAQAITLIESNAEKHMVMAQEVLSKLLPYTGNSIRIGITGVPGAGKSSLIESFGLLLCEKGHRIAVLAVDPSSQLSHGSILGDKTRMEQLSRHKNAYVRPSPSGGTLGGVARKTREALLLCEAAGYEIIIVETVGVGQSEVTVRSMVDFFLVLMLTGAGDELQGMKKGIMELVDAIFINKADGDNRQKALNTRAELNRILHLIRPATAGWETRAFTCSALTGEGIAELWQVISKYREVTRQSGVLQSRRDQQVLQWLESMITEKLTTRFYHHPKVKEMLPKIKESILAGEYSIAIGLNKLLDAYDGK